MGKKAKIRRRKRCLVTRRIGESLLCILASYPVNTVRKQYFVSSTIIVLMNY